MNGKVITAAAFAAQRRPAKVVFTNGCFDLLHAGHVACLQAARALGECLIVGLNSDASVRMLGKGPGRPVNSEHDRAAVLAALACVDYVIIFAEATPAALIAAVQPDVLVKGGDWSPDTIVGADTVRARGGEVRAIPYVAGYSTTNMLKRAQAERVLAVIPARYASTRFPGKPLALLAGHPMIEWVYRQAAAAPNVSAVVVATDDERIADAVRAFGGEAVLTGDCASGTDRAARVAATRDEEIIVNVQGDEPLLAGSAVAGAVQALRDDPYGEVATAAVPLAPADADNPNVVKVVCDDRGYALYFSRAAIPFHRAPLTMAPQYRRHLGIYVYRRDALARWAALPAADLEEREKLEQLRWLAAGGRLRVATVAGEPLGVDTPEDLAAVAARLHANPQENIFAGGNH